MKKILPAAALVVAALAARAQAPAGPILSFTATTSNVAGAPDSIKIDLFRWSTGAERDRLVAAWTHPALPVPAGRGGRGRGAPAPAPVLGPDGNPPAGAGPGGVGAAAGGGRGGGRGAGRGGRGGGASAPVAPVTPESSLTAALGNAPAVGRLWSSEVAGYSVRYAVKLAEPDGGERILLVTDRRLGAYNDLWKPVGPDAAANYEFSVVELRLNSQGEGEGKASLTGRVAVDSAAKTIGLENYGALPVIFKNVRRK